MIKKNNKRPWPSPRLRCSRPRLWKTSLDTSRDQDSSLENHNMECWWFDSTFAYCFAKHLQVFISYRSSSQQSFPLSIDYDNTKINW